MKKTSHSFLASCITLFAFLFLSGMAPMAQNVAKVEYYLDNDPGFGNGVNVPVSPGADITAAFQVSLNAVADGFHKLYVRAYTVPYQVALNDTTTVTKGGWSLTSVRSLYKQSLTGNNNPQGANIVRGEYYIDSDPGFGAGSPIAVSPGKDLTNVSFALNVAALSSGFHNLYIRFQDANGNWSLTPVRTFYKQNLIINSTNLPDVVQGEYYFDTDPGFGSGTNISLSPGKDIANISFTADITSLGQGFHRLYTRFKDAHGSWGHTNTRTFFKQTFTASDSLSDVVKVEYYIDTDPGYGSGINVPVTPGKNINNISFVLNMNEISIGNHKLYVRAQDAKGAWSLVNTRSFEVETPTELIITVGNTVSDACAGDSILVPFTVNAQFGSNNVFTAQLSNSSGSFSSPVNIGTLTGRDSGTIHARIPANTVLGNGYRIRIIASSPFDTSAAGNTILKVGRVPEQSFSITGSNSTCLGQKTYSASSVEQGATYTWEFPGGGTIDSSGATANINWTTSGVYTLRLTASNACGSGTARTLQVTVYGSAPKTAPVLSGTDRSLIASLPTTADSATGYQWYKDSVAIPGATSRTYNAVGDGTFTVRYTNPCGAGPASNGRTIIGNRQAQTITFDTVGVKTYGDPYVIVKATASSSLPVTYSLISGPGTLKSDTLTITGAGNIRVRASQAGDSTWLPATADQIIQVNKASATVVFNSLVKIYNGSAQKPTVTTTPANLPVAYTFNGNSATPVNAGAYEVVVTVSSNNYSGSATDSFYIEKAAQSISLVATPDQAFGNATFKLKAVAHASSGLPVSLSLSTNPAGMATLSGDTITVTAAGTVIITATQPGNGNYFAAAAVKDTFNVSSAPDLTVQSVSSDQTSVAPGDTVTVSWNVGNTGTASSAVNWTERIYMQSAGGGNRTLVKQTVFSNNNTLNTGQTLSRSDNAVIPSQLNIGDAGVFVVELIPGATIKEATGSTANNIAVQQTSWTINKLLTLDLSTSQITEGSAQGISALVKRSGSISAALTVTISLGHPQRFTVPASVIIPAGHSGATFTILAKENSTVDGTITDTLRVSASGFPAAKAALTIIDNDKATLTINNLPAEAMEGATVTFQVATNLAPAQPLQVFLTSSSQARFPVPASVTIPAGALSATVAVTLAQDNTPEIDASVNIVAGASNHNPANDTIKVKDDDLPGLELVVQTNAISESGGAFATQATLRRTAQSNPAAFTANLSASLPNTLILPSSISLAEGENEKTFTIGVVDNSLVDGQRNVSITASLFVSSCGCSAPPASSGSVTASLTVSDNDGPTLQLTTTQLTLPEGMANAGTLRVTRNTATNVALTVSLTSSDSTEATLPASAVIPVGQSFVNVPITTIDDGVSDGNQQVYFRATANGFSMGTVWVLVSDQNKPDLQIPAVTVGSSSVQAMAILNYQVSVKNTGAATAPAGVLVRGYLSKNDAVDESDSLISEDVITTAIAAGQTVQVPNAVQVPNLPGQYKLLYWVNPESTMTELLVTNNKSLPVSLTINADYTATATVSTAYFLKGTPVPVTGSAVKSNGTPAANEKVEVYVITNGLRRTVTATTNGAGLYSTQFIPMSNEVGHYIVGASYPGIGATAEQDNFDILGVRINNSRVPQFRVIINDTLTGSLAVENLSNKSLANFSIVPVSLPNGASIRFDTVANFAGNTSINLAYKVTGSTLSPGTDFEVAHLKTIAQEGSVQTLDAFYFCQAPSAYVIADVTKLNVSTSQSKGERIVEFRLVNKGIGSTGNVAINLPQVNWLTSVTPKVLPAMATGDTAVVILKFLALAEVPFNFPVNGNITVTTQNGNSLQIPFSFEKKSETTGAIKVDVTNQFTYYAEGAPKVQGALVKIQNYFSGVVYAEGVTDNAGVFTATGIPEGKHRIVVSKEKHLPYNNTVTIEPGDTISASVFLNYQAITFNWSVVPTAVEDTYDITLVAKFETHVPMPVVTISMPKSMPQLSGTETYAFNVTMTNHGLIAAKDVTLNLPDNDPEYEFVTNYVPTDLLAQQSVQVPVIMRRRTGMLVASKTTGSVSFEAVSQFLGIAPPPLAPQKATTNGGGNCIGFTSVVYWYKCNISTGFWNKGGVLFNYNGRTCSSSGSGGGGGGNPILIGGGGLGGDGFPDCAICPKIFPPPLGETPVYEVERKSCVECIKKLISVVTKCIGPKKLSCAKSVVQAIWVCGSTQSNVPPMFAKTSGPMRTTTEEDPLGPAYQQIANNLAIAIDAYQPRENWNREYFGTMIESDAFAYLDSLTKLYTSSLDSIRTAAQSSILTAMTGYEIQQSALQAFFSRWNTSIYARSQGVLAPNPQYPNIINWNLVQSYTDSIADAHTRAVAKGFTSVDDLYTKSYASLDSLLNKQKEAVCATVKVQFSQQLTMTREAFEGTLEIFNGHPTDAMDSLSVHVQITDADGVPSNGLFEIQTKSLTNLSDITGTGAISAQQKGNVKFLFIPEQGAAPTVPKVYNFSGYVRYFDPYVNAMVTMPLSQVPITVNPSPNLMLHYFMERNILGDDALTSPEIEPSVPAELAVMVENQGYGSAVNMTISSAQPKIIENDKGLAINFSLIGSNFQGQPKKLGVTDINFGTIPALQSRIGQWYFTSSLLGKFVSYEASVVHANSFGNPDLSLVKGVKLHELTRSIRLYGALEDSINDFLVNDIFDANDAPDIIYYSQGTQTAKVYPAASGSFSSSVMPPTFTNTLTVTASSAGWNYIKLADPGSNLYELVSVTRNNGQVIPLNNAWLTFVTLPVNQPPVYENKFHFVDSFAALQPVSYTVVWKPKNLNVPNIVKIEGAPAEMTATQVQNLTVVFDKSINPATFTYEDLALTFQGGPNIMDSTVVITQTDTATFNVNISTLTTGNGFYNFTAQAAGVKDIYGINGLTGKQVTWTQFLDVPVVQAFEGIPEGKVASSYDTIRVLFNVPINETTATAQRFTVLRDGVLQNGTLTIDSVRADKKLFYLSGLDNILTQNGAYELKVDLPNIQSETGVSGLTPQSITLTVDNTGPLVLSLEKSNAGGLDTQHIPHINILFNENVQGFNTASVQLTRNGEVLPLAITQLSNTDLKTWKAGNFEMLTYPDGNYTFTVNLAGITDAIGNSGTGSQQVSWTVNRGTLVTVTNLTVTPDLGFSNTDGITSGNNLNVAFHLNASASLVTVLQKDLSGETILDTLINVAAGNVTIPVTLSAGGNTGIKVVATGANGKEGTAEKTLFVDEIPLTAQWYFEADQIIVTQVDTIPVLFSSKLLSNAGFISKVQFRRNGTLVPAGGLNFEAVNDTLYNIYGLRGASSIPGNYEMRIALDSLRKYSSGKSGSEPASVSWTVQAPNSAPDANAGNDITVTAPGTVNLNGSASSDPDNDPITYRWIAPEGIVLSDSTSATPSFTVSAANGGNTYSFLLIVSDGSLFATDVVDVVTNFTGAVTYYRDADQDGYGNPNNSTTAASQPAGYVTDNTDCDDTRASVHPGAAEVGGNGIDDDCDGQIDELITFYKDYDKDGYGSNINTVQASTAPKGYVAISGDCNDAKKTIYPGAPEICDNLDNDCDGVKDEGIATTTFYKDYDRDGYGNNNSTVQACAAPAGYVSVGGDCNDTKNAINPGATEIADNLDNDCDGLIDEGFNQTTFYRDFDKDGYGNNNVTVLASTAPAGYVATGGDCNDNKNTIYPTAPELCDNLDNDCDGTIDEGIATNTFYKDYDKDGWGNSNSTIQACTAPTGYVAKGGDCNDAKNTVYPGAPELCDNLDNDCDGTIDEGLTLTTFYKDYDKDGWGNSNSTIQACVVPVGYSNKGGDCNDARNTVYPGAQELCDNLDNDCDGTVDEGFTLTTFYRDYDKDTYGSNTATIQACIAPAGYVSRSGDCNDAKNAINPGATEVVNGIDDNCNGVTDESVMTVSVQNKAAEEILAVGLEVKAAPNPTTRQFNLTIQSASNKPLQIRVLDLVGNLVERRNNVAVNATLQIGAYYLPGVYTVEVVQGTEKRIVKLVKL